MISSFVLVVAVMVLLSYYSLRRQTDAARTAFIDEARQKAYGATLPLSNLIEYEQAFTDKRFAQYAKNQISDLADIPLAIQQDAKDNKSRVRERIEYDVMFMSVLRRDKTAGSVFVVTETGNKVVEKTIDQLPPGKKAFYEKIMRINVAQPEVAFLTGGDMADALDQMPEQVRNKERDKSILRVIYPVKDVNDQEIGRVVALFSTQRLAGEQRKALINYLVFTAFTLLLGFLMSLYLAYRLSLPVRILTEGVNIAASGDLEHKIKVPNMKDEIGRLAGAFNSMTEKLNDHEKGLEEVIAKRTHQVHEANRELAELNRSLEEKVQKQVGQINRVNSLKRYLAPQVFDMLLSESPFEEIARKKLTIVFTDVRGFTSLSQELEPEDLISILNEYLTCMTDIIFKYEGTLDKFMGDGLMIFFGDPVPMQDHAVRAVKMAIEMQLCLIELKKKWFKGGQKPLTIGVGINTGYVTVGSIGPENRKDYTAIGNHVNLAARLVSKANEGEILVSQYTNGQINDFVDTELIGPMEFKGFHNTVEVYRVIGMK